MCSDSDFLRLRAALGQFRQEVSVSCEVNRSPFSYYLGSDPLNNGMAWGDAAILAGVTILLVALAYPAFQRRDLRQTG